MLFSIVLILELISATLAAPTSIIFLIVILQSRAVQFQWRVALFLVFVSSITMSVVHIIRITRFYSRFGFVFNDEYIILTNQEILAYTFTVSIYLQSSAVLLFAITQIFTIYTPERILDSIFGNIVFYLSAVLMFFQSNLVSYITVYSDNLPFKTISAYVVIVMDTTSCLIFMFICSVSNKKYKKHLGEVSLEKKYQCSQVYNWSKIMIRSMMIAKICRFVSFVNIIMFFDFNSTEESDAISLAILRIFMNAYIVCLVSSIVILNKKLGKGFFSTSDMNHLRTINGQKIKMDATQDDYSEYLDNQWRLEPISRANPIGSV